MTNMDVSNYKLRQLRSAAAKEGRLDRAVIDELAELPDEHRAYIFRPETRCRVCTSEASTSVNKMLAHAMTYTDILRVLQPVNDILPENERITYNSIANHRKRHFPIQSTANAVYRRIVEKRAEEFDVDFVRGVGGALTPVAYLDVAMNKAFENMVDEGTTVDVETGLKAAEKLHQLTREREADPTDMADIMLKVNRLMEAVKNNVPPEMWEAILAAVEENDDAIVDAEFEEEDDDVVAGYDPGDPDFVDDDPGADEDGHL